MIAYPGIDTVEFDWETKAEALAQAGQPFVIRNFSLSHHKRIYDSLLAYYPLDARLDPAARVLFLEPRPA